VLRCLHRERREAHLSIDSAGEETLKSMTTPDFAPALIEVLAEEEGAHGQTGACQRALRHGGRADCAGASRLRDASLSGAERTVLDWMCRGLAYREIAATLGRSASTVRFHLVNVYRKLGCRNSVEAYNEAIRRGLVDPPCRED
jgi:DNA-binding CsgD family transcriptional regulator